MAVFPGDAEVTSSTNVFGWSGSKTLALRLRSLEAATSVDFNLWRRSGFETRRASSSSSQQSHRHQNGVAAFGSTGDLLKGTKAPLITIQAGMRENEIGGRRVSGDCIKDGLSNSTCKLPYSLWKRPFHPHPADAESGC